MDLSYQISNLEKSPWKIKETLSLIEKEFSYSNTNSFATDFYPLFNENNFQNCSIIIDTEKDKVIAHLGCSKRVFKVNDVNVDILLIGGVCVSSSYQGNGLSEILMKKVLCDNSSCAAALLWSDKIDFYKRKNFYPCISMSESVVNIKGSFKEESFINLSQEDKDKLKFLYDSEPSLKLLRSLVDWKNVYKTTSSSLFIQRDSDDTIVNYFIKNKGQDLEGVIHEYSSLSMFSPSTSGDVLWSSMPLQDSTSLYAALLKILDIDSFREFVLAYTNNMISDIKIEKDVTFSFDNSIITQSIEQFILGVFGPGQYKELVNCKQIYFCGVDSI